MNLFELVQLVSQMRDQQKVYFKTRSLPALIASKELEKKVDHEIKAIIDAKDQSN